MQLSFALVHWHQFLLSNETHHSHNFERNKGSTARPTHDCRIYGSSFPQAVSSSYPKPHWCLDQPTYQEQNCANKESKGIHSPVGHIYTRSLQQHNRIWAWRHESVTWSTVAFGGEVAQICSPLYSIPSLSAVPRSSKMRSRSDQCFNSLPPIDLSFKSNEFVTHVYLPT